MCPPAPRPDWPYPFWFAHRGGGRLAPENTLAAFRAGWARAWPAAECDVKLSADGVAYLLHDDTLERTTTGQGSAETWTWGRLATLDATRGHVGFAPEPPPRLQDVMAAALAAGAVLNLEIKPLPGQDARTGAEVARQAALAHRAAGASTGPLPLAPLLSSFSSAALEAAAQAAPDLPRAQLLDQWTPEACREAVDRGCVALVLHHPLIDAARAQACRDAGLRLLAYTVNDRARARDLAALGVDGLITDALDVFDPRIRP